MRMLDNLFQLQHIDTTDNLQSGLLRLNADNPIYQGHFPNNPITPGACQVQLAQELTEVFLGHDVRIVKIKGVKYYSMMTPDKGDVEWKADISEGSAKYIFMQTGQPVSKIDLQYE